MGPASNDAGPFSPCIERCTALGLRQRLRLFWGLQAAIAARPSLGYWRDYPAFGLDGFRISSSLFEWPIEIGCSRKNALAACVSICYEWSYRPQRLPPACRSYGDKGFCIASSVVLCDSISPSGTWPKHGSLRARRRGSPGLHIVPCAWSKPRAPGYGLLCRKEVSTRPSSRG